MPVLEGAYFEDELVRFGHNDGGGEEGQGGRFEFAGGFSLDGGDGFMGGCFHCSLYFIIMLTRRMITAKTFYFGNWLLMRHIDHHLWGGNLVL